MAQRTRKTSASSTRRTTKRTTRTTTSSTRATARKASSERILTNCREIMNTAISTEASLRTTCLYLGFGKNYVSEIKTSLNERVTDGRFTKKQATEFTRLYKAYQKAYRTA